MIKVIMQNNDLSKSANYRFNYIRQNNPDIRAKNVNIDSLLNRLKIDKKKEKINKLSIFCIACLSFIIVGLIAF